MAQFLAPILNDQQEDANGAPLSGGAVEVYLAGTSTPAATTSDKAGLVPNTNPIVLNTLGVNNQGAVWLTGGVSYKFIIKNSLGIVQRTIDNVSGINDNTVTADQWIVYQAAPTYVSATSFTVAGDQTQIFQINRRLKTTNTGGTIYSTITNSVYSSPNTTVTVRNDSGVLDSGLSQVSYGLISVQNSSVTGLLLNIQTFTANGTYTPTSGCTRVLVDLVGAGGAGGGAPATGAGQVSGGTGGGGGGRTVALVNNPAAGAVAIGAGGVAVNGAAGGNGGTTSYSGITALGGSGGGVAAAAAAVNIDGFSGGGVGAGGNIMAIPGNSSGFTQITAANGGGTSVGAAGPFGGAVRGQGVTGTGVAGAPPAASAYGAGGGGAANNASQAARIGADGAKGLAVFYEYA